MASSADFVEYLAAQIKDAGAVAYKKMFGEYLIYLNGKPVILVCDNTAFVKQLDCIAHLLEDAEVGTPYPGAKPHYVLNADDRTAMLKVVLAIEKATPLPKPRKKRS